MTGNRVLVRACGLLVGLTAVGSIGSGSLAGADLWQSIGLTPVGVYRTGVFDGGGSEIVAYDPASTRVFSVNLAGKRIDVIDISNPAAPFLATTIDVTPWGSQANSVSTFNGVLAVAVEAVVKTDPGKVVFFNAFGGFLSAVTVGALPDMLTFTPNGKLVLVANEGEPNSYGQPDSVDPEGSISIIDVGGNIASLTNAHVTNAGFAHFNNAALDPSIRVFGPGATVAQDLEPEYIAVAPNGKTAFVTLQENNAIGVIDLNLKRVQKLYGLGFKDHNQPGKGMDTSDRDSQTISIQPRPVLGMYQPDAIAVFEFEGVNYLMTANEGDVREWAGLPNGSEASRAGSLNLDPVAYPNGAALKNNASLGRLNVTLFNGNPDNDSDFDQLYSFGARSFSLWSTSGKQVYDSGDLIERLTREVSPNLFNANHSNNSNLGNPNNWTRDSRSDDKGAEPEGVTVAKLFGRTLAFVALERNSGILVVDIAHPLHPVIVNYINLRVVDVDPASAAAEDLGPEGLVVVQAVDSPNGKPLLIVANEVSGTTRIYEISKLK